MVGGPCREDIHNRLDEALDELRTRMGGLPSPVEAEGIWTTIWFEEAHHSTAIEGNTLVFKQVERLLAEGMGLFRRWGNVYATQSHVRGSVARRFDGGASSSN